MQSASVDRVALISLLNSIKHFGYYESFYRVDDKGRTLAEAIVALTIYDLLRGRIEPVAYRK